MRTILIVKFVLLLNRNLDFSSLSCFFSTSTTSTTISNWYYKELNIFSCLQYPFISIFRICSIYV